MCRPMVQFYVDSMRVKGRKPMPSTRDQTVEILERVLDTWEHEYGVTVMDEKIDGLTGAKIQAWFNKASSSWKPATANHCISILNPFLRWAAKMDGEQGDYVQKDFSDILHTQSIPNPEYLPEDQRPKDKYFSVEQVEELLHGGHGRNQKRDTAIIAMFLWSAIRVSELCQVTVGNFRSGAEKNVVKVLRKGGVWKDVKIGDAAYKYVEAYLKTRKNLSDDQPLFMTTHGMPCTRNQIYKCLSFKQKEIGIATGPHALRHTSLSTLEKETSPSVVRDIANHRSFHVTNRYTHSSEEERLAALNALPWK